MIRLSGAGCALVDLIYADVDFSGPAFRAVQSRQAGDGGLEPGGLVFAEDFEAFSGRPCQATLDAITGGTAAATGIGGPSVVSLINAAQLLDRETFQIGFTGAVGADAIGAELNRLLKPLPLTVDLRTKAGSTPFTYVLSDPRFDRGRGERCFVNNIGTAGLMGPGDLADPFFQADFVLFGGTALVPRLHDALPELLRRARRAGAFTVVNTVYDFRSQRRDPVGRWPLGRSDASYGAIDLLVADKTEALRLSGQAGTPAALDWFVAAGVGAAVVTDGAEQVSFRTGRSRFRASPRTSHPVCRPVLEELAAQPELKGDTTGCGDNFAGGLVASLARQLAAGERRFDLEDGLRWAAACGGEACFRLGGVFPEVAPGQKLRRIQDLLARW